MHPRWIYLSPHFDDAILSCGGLIADQVARGALVEVWTVFGGSGHMTPAAEPFHAAWGVDSMAAAIALRKAEDRAACDALGCEWHHMPYADMIYRDGPIPPPKLDFFDDVVIACPLGIHHPDHLLVRQAADHLKPMYYADVPYRTRYPDEFSALARGRGSMDFPITPAGRAAWEKAIACYASQVPTVGKCQPSGTVTLYE